jgi:hypothetical protein
MNMDKFPIHVGAVENIPGVREIPEFPLILTKHFLTVLWENLNLS